MSSSAQKQPLDTPNNPMWCFCHNRFKTNSYAKDTQSNVQQVLPSHTKQVSADPFQDSYNQDWCYYHNQFGDRAWNCKMPCSYIANIDDPRQLSKLSPYRFSHSLFWTRDKLSNCNFMFDPGACVSILPATPHLIQHARKSGRKLTAAGGFALKSYGLLKKQSTLVLVQKLGFST